MVDSKTLLKLSSIMTQTARFGLGDKDSPDINEVKAVISDYCKQKGIPDREFESDSEMMQFVSEAVYEELFSRR
jgi:hypothetical protein